MNWDEDLDGQFKVALEDDIYSFSLKEPFLYFLGSAHGGCNDNSFVLFPVEPFQCFIGGFDLHFHD